MNWQKENKAPGFGPREGNKIIVAKGKMYTFGGVNYELRRTFNDVWVSEDGYNWQKLVENAPWSPRWDHDVAYFNNKFIFYGGMDLGDIGFSDLWTSPDAKDWTLISTNTVMEGRQGHVMLKLKNALFVISGLDAKTNEGKGITWFSLNGRDWLQTETVGSWIPREDHRAVVFKDKIIMTGGMSNGWNWLSDIYLGYLPSSF